MIVLIPVDANGNDGAPRQLDQRHIRVGRGAHNDLVLDQEDTAASYEHAQITVLDRYAVVMCDPTANPTYIEGADISRAPEQERQLHPGEIISFGKGRSLFRVQRIGDAEEPRKAPPPPRIRLPTRKAGSENTRDPLPPLRVADDRARPRGIGPITIRVFKDGQMVRQETFNQPLIRVGRMRSSHLLLDDESVSRTHAVIEVTDAGEVLLIDLDSSSGCAVNGTRVKKAALKSGDQLEFGKARVVLSYGQVTAPAMPAPPPVAVAEAVARRAASPPPPVPRVSEPSAPLPAAARGKPDSAAGARILVRKAGVAQDSIELSKAETTIGRLPECDIQLDDSAVSGKHALLVAEAGLFLVVDQRSTNGTYVNGERCNGETLKDGDVIQIGRFELVFIAPKPAPAPQAPKTEVLSPEAARAMFAKINGPRGAPK